MAMTVAEATTYRALLITAITAIATGGVSEYAIAGRKVTKLDLPKLREELAYCDEIIAGTDSRRPTVVRFREPG